MLTGPDVQPDKLMPYCPLHRSPTKRLQSAAGACFGTPRPDRCRGPHTSPNRCGGTLGSGDTAASTYVAASHGCLYTSDSAEAYPLHSAGPAPSYPGRICVEAFFVVDVKDDKSVHLVMLPTSTTLRDLAVKLPNGEELTEPQRELAQDLITSQPLSFEVRNWARRATTIVPQQDWAPVRAAISGTDLMERYLYMRVQCKAKYPLLPIRGARPTSYSVTSARPIGECRYFRQHRQSTSFDER